MPEASLWSLLPPLAAIALAVWTRRVLLSLASGIVLGALIEAGGAPLGGVMGAMGAVAGVITDPSSARLLLFAALIGPLVGLMESHRGMEGLALWLAQRGLVRGRRGARMLAWCMGVMIFIESNITLLVTGAVCRPLFDDHDEPREGLAYIADSTSAPICILVPFNAWGAFVLGILETQGVERPLSVFVGSIALNFYALAAVSLAGVTAWTGLRLGAMRHARAVPPVAPAAAAASQALPPAAVHLVLPITVLLISMPLALLVTGGGSLSAGSGSTAALAAILAANAAAVLLLLARRVARPGRLAAVALRGLGDYMGVIFILLLAMTLGEVCRDLGTGATAARLLEGVASPALLLPLTFLIASLIAFATGTSWGTFALVLPIAVPAAVAMGLPPAPFLAACLSGGVFGDHASPISDTTIVASMAASTEVIAHVRTQLPYALLAGAVALGGFVITGLLL